MFLSTLHVLSELHLHVSSLICLCRRDGRCLGGAFIPLQICMSHGILSVCVCARTCVRVLFLSLSSVSASVSLLFSHFVTAFTFIRCLSFLLCLHLLPIMNSHFIYLWCDCCLNPHWLLCYEGSHASSIAPNGTCCVLPPTPTPPPPPLLLLLSRYAQVRRWYLS